LLWQYVIYQQGGAFHHASCPTTGAKSSAFAVKGDQTILVARGTLDPDEPVFQMAASQKVVEFLNLHEMAMVGPAAPSVWKRPGSTVL
jgi:hypothetical protein